MLELAAYEFIWRFGTGWYVGRGLETAFAQQYIRARVVFFREHSSTLIPPVTLIEPQDWGYN